MTNLTEKNEFPIGIYQVETTDPAIGGAPNSENTLGIINRAAQQLAYRTHYLKARLDSDDPLTQYLDETRGDVRYYTKAQVSDFLDEATPVGSISGFLFKNPPTGWLECNGAAINRVSYKNLFAKIGIISGKGRGSKSFNLPDLRGEFLRGWDNLRGTDKGRKLGSAQGDAIRDIVGNVGTVGLNSKVNGAFKSTKESGVTISNGGEADDHVTFNASRVVPTANENRPRNIAVMFCIKY